MTESVEQPEEEKSFFFRGAVLGLAGGAVAAVLLISVVGTVISLGDDVFGSSSDTAMDEPVVVDPLVATGETLAASNGCVACHSTDGVDGVGPTWQGLSASVDAEYIRTAIVDPNAVIADGYTAGVMPDTYGDTLSEEDLDALVAYISSL